MKKVSVDYDLCSSTGACQQVAPQIFEVRTDGYMYVLGGYDAALPDDMVEIAERAAGSCPNGAISIVEA